MTVSWSATHAVYPARHIETGPYAPTTKQVVRFTHRTG